MGQSTYIRDGFVSAGNAQVSGSLSVTGGITGVSLLVSGSSLVAGYNPTPLAGTIKDGVTSVLGSLQDWNSGYYSGEVLYSETAAGAINFGQICYRTTTGSWGLAVATAAGVASTHMLGICLLDAEGVGEPTSILTRGYVETTYIAAGNMGDPIFIPAPVGNAGSLTATAPSAAGNVVRVVGHVFWDSASQTNGKWIISFNPDNTWIEL